jgi:uncharacterized RmlC-like cupin family protein
MTVKTTAPDFFLVAPSRRYACRRCGKKVDLGFLPILGDSQLSKSRSGFVRVIQPGKTYVGKQGFSYGAGVSAETVGAKRICMNVLPMPPGARAKVHFHRGIETIAYLLEGECAVYYGDELESRVVAQIGDQVYLPEDVPHSPYNQSTKPCKWLVVHSSGSDQDGIVLLPELDIVLAKM